MKHDLTTLDPNTFEGRLARIINDSGLNRGAFAKSIGISPTYLVDVLFEGKRPGMDIIIKISDLYPQYTTDFILKGTQPAQKSAIVEKGTQVDEIREILEMDDLVVKMELVKTREAVRIYKEQLEESNRDHGLKIENIFTKIDSKLEVLIESNTSPEGHHEDQRKGKIQVGHVKGLHEANHPR